MGRYLISCTYYAVFLSADEAWKYFWTVIDCALESQAMF